jgi:hypothetical protein
MLLKKYYKVMLIIITHTQRIFHFAENDFHQKRERNIFLDREI